MKDSVLPLSRGEKEGHSRKQQRAQKVRLPQRDRGCGVGETEKEKTNPSSIPY